MHVRSRLAIISATVLVFGLTVATAEAVTAPFEHVASHHVINQGADHVSPVFPVTADNTGSAQWQTPTGIDAGKWFSGLIVCAGGQGVTTWTISNQKGQPIGQAQGAAPYIGPIFVPPGGILTFNVKNALANAALSVTLYGFIASNPANLPVLPPLAGQSTIGLTQQPWSYPNQLPANVNVGANSSVTITPAGANHLFLFQLAGWDAGAGASAEVWVEVLPGPAIVDDVFFLPPAQPLLQRDYRGVDLGVRNSLGRPLRLLNKSTTDSVQITILYSTSDGSAAAFAAP